MFYGVGSGQLACAGRDGSTHTMRQGGRRRGDGGHAALGPRPSGPAQAAPAPAGNAGSASWRLFENAAPPDMESGESGDRAAVAVLARHGVTQVSAGLGRPAKRAIIKALKMLNGPGATAEETHDNMLMAIGFGTQKYDAAMTLLRAGIVIADSAPPGERPVSTSTENGRHTFLHALAGMACDATVGVGMRDACTPKRISLRVSDLVAAGADVNARDANGKTPLELALWYNPRSELIESLTANGADHVALDDNGETMLHRAITERRMDVVSTLLAIPTPASVRAESVNLMSGSGKTSFDFAAEHSPAEEARQRLMALLINRGIDLRYQTAALNRAVEASNAGLVADLLAVGVCRDDIRLGSRAEQLTALLQVTREAAPNRVSSRHWSLPADVFPTANEGGMHTTPSLLSVAAHSNPNVGVVGALINASAEPERIYFPSQQNAVHAAAADNPNPNVVPLMLARGCSPNTQNHFHMTPLHFASVRPPSFELDEIISALIAAGADPALQDDAGISAQAACDHPEEYWLLQLMTS